VVLVDGYNDEDGLEALHAGARGILPRLVERSEIVVAIKAVTSGLVVLPRELMPALLNAGSDADEVLDGNDAVRTLLTARESSKSLQRWQTAPPTKRSHVDWESLFTPPSFTSPPFSPSSMRTAGLKRLRGLRNLVS